MKNRQDSKILSGFINMLFDLIKHFIKDFENIMKLKKIDHVDDNFSNLEHLMVRLEERLEDCRKQIDELKNKLFFAQVINIILLLFIIYHLLTS